MGSDVGIKVRPIEGSPLGTSVDSMEGSTDGIEDGTSLGSFVK